MLQLLEKLYTMQDLSSRETYKIFEQIIQGNIEPIILSSILTALKIKGEVPNEIAGAAQALRDNALSFPTPEYDFADIVGTGGDGMHTINISTTAAFVAAACGFKIAKHGNRGISSKSGSSDLLNAMQIKLDSSPKKARLSMDKLGLCFLFAPMYHQGFRHAHEVRKLLKTRTIFNILGPLINPANANLILLGVYDPKLIEPIAQTLLALKIKRAVVVHGSGLDEVAIHDQTQVAEIKNNKITKYVLHPKDFGLKTYPLEAIKGGSPLVNKKISSAILQGLGSPAQIAAVAANTALLMRLFDHEDLKENTRIAIDTMSSGKAYKIAQQLTQYQ